MNQEALSPEEELLVLACHLVLPPTGEARLENLLRSPLRWPWLQEEAAQLRAEPLLHHHLSRLPLRDLVPAEVLDKFRKAYERTSMKNLQIYGILRRVLLALGEAQVPVILLKGSFLAKWIYADIGLRPMGDIDLLCRKQDEAVLWRILGEQGATGGEEPLESEKLKAIEHVFHGPARYFGQITRLEVHFYLLSSRCSDPDQLQEAIWARAQVHDWDGLAVRSLGWEHQILHLATHFHKHADSSGIFLYWCSDLKEVLRAHGGDLDWETLGSLAMEIGMERECREVFELLGESWRGSGPPARRFLSDLGKVLAKTRAFRQPGMSALSTYREIFLAGRFAGGPRERWLYVFRLVFPPWERMAFRHPGSGPFVLATRYLLDPLVRIGRLLKALVRHVQPLSRH